MPTAMLEDALLDLTHRGEIVLNPFLGSGSTLIAADKTARVCLRLELDPLYVDVITRRYEAHSGGAASWWRRAKHLKRWPRAARIPLRRRMRVSVLGLTSTSVGTPSWSRNR